MEPFLEEGLHVMTFNWGIPKSRDVIVFVYNDKFYIKRVDLVLGNKVVVSGDNKRVSSKFKPIDLNRVIGRVVLKY